MARKVVSFVLMFVVSLLYLHQKVLIYVEAYRLNETYQAYNNLVDARDDLLYNFSQKISLEKVNCWVENNGFTLAEGDKMLALHVDSPQSNPKERKPKVIASSLAHIFRLSGISKVLAQEQP